MKRCWDEFDVQEEKRKEKSYETEVSTRYIEYWPHTPFIVIS